jgi:hypothetical protein
MAYTPPSYPTTAPTGALGMNEAVSILKELYDNQKVQVMSYKKSPLLAMIRKMDWFGGKFMPLPIQVEVSTGRSSTFANAQGNQNPAVLREFALTRIKDYSIAQIDRETMKAAANDKMAFISTVTLVVDAALKAATNSLCSAFYRDGTGAIGSYGANGGAGTITSGVIVFDDPSQVVNFAIGQVLEARATAGGTQSTSNALGYVIARNGAAGTITVSASAGGSAGTPTNWSTSFPFLNVQGDNNLKLTGLPAWLPQVAPTAGSSFFSIDRSIDTRLYGVNYDGTQQSIEEAIVDAAAILEQEGGEPDVCILSVRGYAALTKALGARAVYETWEGPAEIAFKGVVLNTGTGQVRVFSDLWCPGKTGYLLQMDTWVLASLGQAPEIFDYDDDTQFLRIYNADAAELRCGYIAQLGCNAPGWNASLKLVA